MRPKMSNVPIMLIRIESPIPKGDAKKKNIYYIILI